MRHLDIHNDQIRRFGLRHLQRIATIAQRFRFEIMGAQQIAKKFSVEIVVLDNEQLFRHVAPGSLFRKYLGDDDERYQ